MKSLLRSLFIDFFPNSTLLAFKELLDIKYHIISISIYFTKIVQNTKGNTTINLLKKSEEAQKESTRLIKHTATLLEDS